jgi:hypothetical protein
MYTNQITLTGKLSLSEKGVRAYTPYGEVVWAGASMKTMKSIVDRNGDDRQVFVTSKVLKTRDQEVAEVLTLLDGKDVLVVGELVTENFAKKDQPAKWNDVIIVTSIEPLDI